MTSFLVAGFLLLLGFLGVLLVVLGVYAFLQRCCLTLFGEHTVGTVAGFMADADSAQPDRVLTEMDLLPPMPHLRIHFTDYFGASHEVTTASSVSAKEFRPGDPVPLLYRTGHADSFVVDRFWMKWSAPLLFTSVGLVLLICPLIFLGTVWPAFGAWGVRIARESAPFTLPLVSIGLPALFALLGAHMVRQRLRRLREDYRTQGTITATGLVARSAGGGGGSAEKTISQWICVTYRDADDHKHTRILWVSTGLLARTRHDGQTVDLLVDHKAPQHVMLNELGELWFAPFMFLALGSIITIVFTWAWLSGNMAV